jgi:hypothetical protein
MSPDLLRMGGIWGSKLTLQDGDSDFRCFLRSDGNTGQEVTAITRWIELACLSGPSTSTMFGERPAWGAKSPQVKTRGRSG